jgi:hypothetical protein
LSVSVRKGTTLGDQWIPAERLRCELLLVLKMDRESIGRVDLGLGRPLGEFLTLV